MKPGIGFALVVWAALWDVASPVRAAPTAPPQTAPAPTAAATSAPVGAASLDLYGRLPSLADVALSPDGARLAFVATKDGQRSLIIVDLAQGKPVAALRVSDTKLRSLGWADDEHLLILYSTASFPPFGFTGGLYEWAMLLSYDVATAKLRPINLDDSDVQTLNVVERRISCTANGNRNGSCVR
ncbi:MAG: hypothetical protein KGL92_05985 [Gammaproteobacteria bacterium]|nr:hypothetical protein [Gammaproteobacteria bacterium]MDE2348034.1 hypothetical protein [Gammaproteobacteria bacterium]